MARSFLHELRRQAGSLLIDGLFEASSALWRALPAARPERHGVERVTDVPYRTGGDRAHLLDVYRPHGQTGPLPAVLYIHGGSFRILSKDSHFMIATAFARAGYVVFNINYRLSPAHRFPAALEDVADAYRWVVENGARWGADLSRFVIGGESAGGNLTLSAAIMATYERPESYARRVFQLGIVPRAIVPLCGMLQVSHPEMDRGSIPKAYIQDRIDVCAEGYLGKGQLDFAPERALADPIILLEGGRPKRAFPAVFSSVGTNDPLLQDTQRLDRRLEELGVEHEVKIYEGEPHAFQAMLFRERVRAHWQSVFAFLERTLRAQQG